MKSEKPKSSKPRIARNSSTGELVKVRVIAHHPNGLPILAGSDRRSDVTREEALAAVRSVMGKRLSGRFAAKH